jgi:hypothetical protein
MQCHQQSVSVLYPAGHQQPCLLPLFLLHPLLHPQHSQNKQQHPHTPMPLLLQPLLDPPSLLFLHTFAPSAPVTLCLCSLNCVHSAPGSSHMHPCLFAPKSRLPPFLLQFHPSPPQQATLIPDLFL